MRSLRHSTCDVEVDLDLVVFSRAFDLSVPLGAVVKLQAAVLVLGGELPGACGKARFKVGIVLGALSAPVVPPTSWY